MGEGQFGAWLGLALFTVHGLPMNTVSYKKAVVKASRMQGKQLQQDWLQSKGKQEKEQAITSLNACA